MSHELTPGYAQLTHDETFLHSFGMLYRTRPIDGSSYLDESAFLRCQERPDVLLSDLHRILDAMDDVLTSQQIGRSDHQQIRIDIQNKHPRALSLVDQYYSNENMARITSLPYSNFELMLATSLATSDEENVWSQIHQIETHITHLISSNPLEFWNSIRLFNLDRILPPFARMEESQKNAVSSILEHETGERTDTENNRRIFRKALESAAPEYQLDQPENDEEFFNRTIRLLPNLDRYYDPSLPEGQSQKPEYYMTLVHMAAHRTRIPGWEPFAAMLVHQGHIISVKNNIPIKGTNDVLHQYHHAEKLLLEDVVLLQTTGGDFSGYDMYCSASPCGEWAGAMRKFRVGPHVFIGVETTMGESVHGILGSNLQKQGPPYTDPPSIQYVDPGGIFKTLYVVDMGWSIFIPEHAQETIQSL